jgi:hypothetical protein
MTNVLVPFDHTVGQLAPPAPTEVERHDFHYWDRVAGYVERDCLGCGDVTWCFDGMCQACWTGLEVADDVQRCLDQALKAIAKADEFFAQAIEQGGPSFDRIKEIHHQAAQVSAAGSNFRLQVMKQWRRS